MKARLDRFCFWRISNEKGVTPIVVLLTAYPKLGFVTFYCYVCQLLTVLETVR
jgi:hypothetical protein